MAYYTSQPTPQLPPQVDNIPMASALSVTTVFVLFIIIGRRWTRNHF